ncbi:MFS transporter [Ureibacillus chungkukjangi]|uniref:DHA3 family macrolide efflux protein-like MFS transporter n=1 Tax=Ureibacillus chungkukjangi TaxID=1202712 RepID=A0A318U420_9BACL|nr:MFS transporter [Ureibacillus chungkukjangi]MCM3388731.1 MFS transporter [Ureibacillus chungkukjangi]PYF06639.1 DHA3 family macrolide efflux protein-like MFS transporter [Ureibacillus chungkukjangi]
MSQSEQVTVQNWKKSITLFLGSQTISLFGSALVQYAIMWYITLTTQSGIMMTISIICGFVPTFFLSPFGGVWADRYNRKVLILLADSMIAISTLILAILFLNGFDSMWLLFAISAVRAVGTGIQTPAVGAILPQIVPADKLTKVNGANGSIQALIMLVAPIASAGLLATTSIEIIFFIDVITAAIAVFTLLFFLKVPLHEKAKEAQTTGYFSDFKMGLTYINNHAFLKKFFTFFAMFLILAAPAAFLTPLQVTRSFGANEWYLSAIEIAFSIGMMAGGIIIASWGGFKNKTYTMAISAFGFGLGTVLLGIVPVFWIYLLVMALVGLVMPMFNTPATVLLQEKVEPDYLGRVFGVLTMISTSIMPLGMIIFGPLADVVAIEWLLIGTGILLFMLGFVLLGSKVLIEAGKPDTE